METVSMEAIQRIKEWVQQEQPENAIADDDRTAETAASGRFNVGAYLDHYGIKHRIKKHKKADLYVLEKCTFDENHTGGEAAIGQAPNCKLFYQCFHDSCQKRTWVEAREKISGKEKLTQFSDGSNSMKQSTSRSGDGVTKVTSMMVNQDEKIFPVCDFPLHAFPKPFQQLISDVSKSLHVDPAISAGIILTVTSGTIGNSVRVLVKHGWNVPLFLWLIVVAPSGYGKSPAIRAYIDVLNKLQGNAWRRFQELLKEYEEELEKYEAQHKEFRRKKVPACGDVPIAKKPIMPVLDHYLVSDATVAALARVLLAAQRGVLIHTDELAGLIKGMDQFKGGGKGNDRQFYLQLFDAQPWKIDRAKETQYIPNTGAALIGGIQNTIMPSIMSGDTFEDGLLPRFIMSCPDDKPMVFSDQSVSADNIQFWEGHVGRCFRIPLEIGDDGFVKPKMLVFDEVASVVMVTFYNELGEIISFLSPRARVFVPKLITYFLKFAGILHVIKEITQMGNLQSSIISVETVNHAVDLTRYYMGQVTKVLKLYGNNDDRLSEHYRRLIQVLYDLQDQVNGSKLYLSNIKDKYNTGIPETIQLSDDNKSLSAMLRTLGLKTDRGTGGYAYLQWDTEKIDILFVDNIVTITTIATPGEQSGILSETNITDVTTAPGPSEYAEAEALSAA